MFKSNLVLILLIALALAPYGSAAVAPTRADMEARGWVSVSDLAEGLKVNPWDLRFWVDENVPPAQIVRVPVWTRSTWVPLVYVSPEAARGAWRHFRGRGAPGGPVQPGPGDEFAASLNADLAEPECWWASRFDLALSGVAFFPRKDAFETSPGAELALRYWPIDPVALALEAGYGRWNLDDGEQWLMPPNAASYGDIDLFPVGLSALWQIRPAPKLTVGIRAGVRYVVTDSELFLTGGELPAKSVIEPDLDDGVAGVVAAQMHARVCDRWGAFLEVGYQFDLDKPEVTYDWVDRAGGRHSENLDVPLESALVRAGLTFGF